MLEITKELGANFGFQLFHSTLSEQRLNPIRSHDGLNHTVPASESYKLAVYLQEACSIIFLSYEAKWVNLPCLCLSKEKEKARNHNSYACCGIYRERRGARKNYRINAALFTSLLIIAYNLELIACIFLCRIAFNQGTDKYLIRVLLSQETAHLIRTYVDGLTRRQRTQWIGGGTKGNPPQGLPDRLGMFQVNDLSDINFDGLGTHYSTNAGLI